jgi:flagellar motor switch protein FliN/FliY
MSDEHLDSDAAPESVDPVSDALFGAVDEAVDVAPDAFAGDRVIEDVELEQLVPLDADDGGATDISALLDVPLEVAVELGRARVTIRDLLDVGQGSIMSLGRHAGDPVDVLVNGKCLARGEVVVIDEDFGIRITQVVSQEERLRSMGQ